MGQRIHHSKPILVLAVLLLAALFCFLATGPSSLFSTRPNILLITVDTLRADRLGCYGYRLDTSPNMDRLASKGVRFTDCTVQWPKTWPSMASLFTGGYPKTTGMHYNISHSGDWVVMALSDKAVGIDVERVRSPQYRIAERFFSPTELAALNRLEGDEKARYFFDLWTLKESYLKLLGKGLTQSLGSFTVANHGAGFQLLIGGKAIPDVHFSQVIVDPAYKVSICHRSGACNASPTLLEVRDLLKPLQNGN